MQRRNISPVFYQTNEKLTIPRDFPLIIKHSDYTSWASRHFEEISLDNLAPVLQQGSKILKSGIAYVEIGVPKKGEQSMCGLFVCQDVIRMFVCDFFAARSAVLCLA